MISQPKLTYSNKIIELCIEIAQLLTELKSKNFDAEFYERCFAKKIQSSLAIEGNNLTYEDVYLIGQGKQTLTTLNDLIETKNAFNVNKILLNTRTYRIKSLLRVHKVLMLYLINDAGAFRTQNVGISNGRKIIYKAPAPEFVPKQIKNLMKWSQVSKMHPLIKACIFHFEFETIHPFSDGNGRMGRLWQTLILAKWDPIFFWLPFEENIYKRQSEYYDSFQICRKNNDSQLFVELQLKIIKTTLLDIKTSTQPQLKKTDRLLKLQGLLRNRILSTTELMLLFDKKNRTNFRNNYLKPALEQNLIAMTVPHKPTSSKQKYKLN